MASQPPSNSGSLLDKLSKDVSQYRQSQAGRLTRRRILVSAGRQQSSSDRPALTELDSTLGSQIIVGLLIAGYAILMLAASVLVIVLNPAAAPVLWPVMAIGVIVAMVAWHKGRPPLLWFMYGSILPMLPLVHAVLAGGLSWFIGAGKAPAILELLAYSLPLGTIPLMHVSLVPQDQIALEARHLDAGMKKCPFCAELIKQDAKVCRYCRKDLPEPQPV